MAPIFADDGASPSLDELDIAPARVSNEAGLGRWIRPGAWIAGRYRLRRLLGLGGMASVWLAYDASLEEECAVKLLDSEKTLHQETRVRFHGEAHVGAHIRSEHVVGILDYGEWQGIPYIAMEYLQGEDLRARLERLGVLEPSAVYELVTQLASALMLAHAAGIVHRDIKPENVFLVPREEGEVVKLVDFGVAKETEPRPGKNSTQQGLFLGTPIYASPEQIRGEAVDWRSDLWSLAVVAHECLTGRPPIDCDSVGELCGRILYEPLPALNAVEHGLPVALDAWWQRASERDPNARFQSAKKLADALGTAIGVNRASVPSLIAHIDLPCHVDLARVRSQPFIPNRRVHSRLAAAAAVITLAGGCAAWVIGSTAPKPFVTNAVALSASTSVADATVERVAPPQASPASTCEIWSRPTEPSIVPVTNDDSVRLSPKPPSERGEKRRHLQRPVPHGPRQADARAPAWKYDPGF